MNVEQLMSVLREYPPSLRLVIVVEQHPMVEMTVVELMLKLMTQPPGALLTYYGCSNCILREKMDSKGGDAIVPMCKMWLELDLR